MPEAHATAGTEVFPDSEIGSRFSSAGSEPNAGPSPYLDSGGRVTGCTVTVETARAAHGQTICLGGCNYWAGRLDPMVDGQRNCSQPARIRCPKARLYQGLPDLDGVLDWDCDGGSRVVDRLSLVCTDSGQSAKKTGNAHEANGGGAGPGPSPRLRSLATPDFPGYNVRLANGFRPGFADQTAGELLPGEAES